MFDFLRMNKSFDAADHQRQFQSTVQQGKSPGGKRQTLSEFRPGRNKGHGTAFIMLYQVTTDVAEQIARHTIVGTQ